MALVYLGLAWVHSTKARAAESVAETLASLQTEYSASLEELAANCERNTLTDEAQQTRARKPRLDPWRLHLVDPPAAVSSAQDEVSPLAADWRAAFDKLRKGQANKLFELAQRAIAEKQPSLGLELTLAALREDSDQAGARRVLGYQRSGDFWRTPFEIAQAKKGLQWHDEFGWLRQTEIERYEAGERRRGSRWISAEDDAAQHAEISKGWQIETEHYRVTTNHSLQAGVRLAGELEFLYRSWKQVFLRFHASDKDLLALFEGKPARGGKMRRHEVVYFRDRAEYQEHLRGSVPEDFVTTGIYIGDQKTAYFYDDPAIEDHTTLYHEATHQLFSETRSGVREPASKANFWIVEGVACYMETLARVEGGCTVGGNDGDRFLSARHWLTSGEFFVPLAELSSWGQDDIQRHEKIATLYSQSAGLTHFLMHYEHGQYRDAAIRLLEAIYTGRDTPGTLAELADVPFDTLDEQYRQFMQP
ncbi:MAG: DUF1570 domain-containing protein [Pirellulales bacterium]